MNPPINHSAASAAAPFKIPGRLAHKWIEDFLRCGFADEPDLLSFQVGCSALGSFHNFVAKADQCVTTELRYAGGYHMVIVAAICTQCRYHFMFRASAPSGKLCGKYHSNPQKPLHHLTAAAPISKDFEACSLDEGRNPKYLSCCGHAAYTCSALDCSYRVNVEVSQPRLPQELADVLLDDEAVKLRLHHEMKTSPERFGNATSDNKAIDYLSQYLTDALAPPQTRKGSKIRTRNVKFAVQFGDGPSGNKLFGFLEFKKGFDDDQSTFWELPSVEDPDRKPTVVPSRKSFYQDIRAEIWCLKGQGVWPENNARIGFKDRLKDALYCSERDYPGLEVDRVPASSVGDKSDYDLLGLTTSSTWTIFRYAFECQVRTDRTPEHRPIYLDALQRISASVNRDELNVFIATEQSRIDALKWEQNAGISPSDEIVVLPNGNGAGDFADWKPVETIIGEYRNKVQNSTMSPTKETAARKRLDLRRELFKTATTHPDGLKLKEVVREPMELDEALVCLELPIDEEQLRSMDSSVPQALAQGQIEQGKDAFLTGMALSKIGDFLGNDMLISLATTLMGEQQSLDSIKEDEPTNDPNLPAGLDNLRNTCYLNSMLQYFFTINPVRNLVLNFDEYKLPDTEESRSARRITTEERGISAKQAYVANELANELRSLFSELISSTNHYATPTQRLALAAMKNTDQLEARAKELANQSNEAIAQHSIGPLTEADVIIGQDPNANAQSFAAKAPNYAAPVPPTRVTNGGKGPGGSSSEHIETRSDVSSQTLVYFGPDDNGVVQDAGAEWNPMIRRVNSIKSRSSADSMRCEVEDDDMMEQHFDSNSNTDRRAFNSGADIEMIDTSLHSLADSTALATGAPAPAGTADSDSSMDTEEDTISRIKRALDDKTIKGTDQEDVQEAMDKMLFNLRSAIKPTGTEPLGPKSEVQTDAITEILRLIKVEYQKPLNSARWELTNPTTEDFLLAYPARSGSVALHEALERGFMRQISENPQEPENPFLSFSSIRKFPPILHICIQRTVYDQSARAGKKIDVSIELPQVLYMDRYRESAPGDALWMRRHKYWDYMDLEHPKHAAARKKLEGKKQTSVDQDTAMNGSYNSVDEIEAYHRDAVNELTGADVEGVDSLAAEKNGTKNSDLSPSSSVGLEGEDSAEAEAEARRQKFDDSFDDLREHEYYLHAVICHGGSTGASGHYWVWIYDFDQQVWYNYNDRRVQVHKDNQKVLKDLSASDQPYYIAYVRKDKLDLVSIPARAGRQQQQQTMGTPLSPPYPPPPRVTPPAGLDVEMDT